MVFSESSKTLVLCNWKITAESGFCITQDSWRDHGHLLERSSGGKTLSNDMQSPTNPGVDKGCIVWFKPWAHFPSDTGSFPSNIFKVKEKLCDLTSQRSAVCSYIVWNLENTECIVSRSNELVQKLSFCHLSLLSPTVCLDVHELDPWR